jgi:NhaA family Na+:H+ antiporter
VPPTDDQAHVQAPREFHSPWLRSERPLPRFVVRPLEQFLHTETGSGALLLGAALLALIWANVAGESYDDVWSTSVSLGAGSFALELDLRHVVNDLLMAVFFYVVALEVKREMLFGTLRDRQYAAVPVAAALGTMIGAAVVYVAVNLDGGQLGGWAIPIATDIAFALSVLGLAGRRAPESLRAFLLTLAVVDDLGTILVIAVFYSGGLSLAWLAAAAGAVAAVVLMSRLAVRMLVPYVLAAGLLWLAIHESGVHATIAGVILGFLTPAVAFYPRQATGDAIAAQLNDIAREPDVEVTGATMSEVSRLAREAVSPLARMEQALHPWSAYVVLPVFALANAGVAVSLAGIGDALTSQVGLGIFLGLVIGAPIGGFLLAWGLVKATPVRLSAGLDWSAIAGVAPLKGIGFTVAIFISLLAFDDKALQEQATLSILVASFVAGVIGLCVLMLRHRLQSR